MGVLEFYTIMKYVGILGDLPDLWMRVMGFYRQEQQQCAAERSESGINRCVDSCTSLQSLPSLAVKH